MRLLDSGFRRNDGDAEITLHPRSQTILRGVNRYLLRRKLRGFVEVNQVGNFLHVQQAVHGVVVAQFFQGHAVALDAVAGAVEQGQVVEFVVALGSLGGPAGADVVHFQQGFVQAAVGPAGFVAAAPALGAELVHQQLLGLIFGDAPRPAG